MCVLIKVYAMLSSEQMKLSQNRDPRNGEGRAEGGGVDPPRNPMVSLIVTLAFPSLLPLSNAKCKVGEFRSTA